MNSNFKWIPYLSSFFIFSPSLTPITLAQTSETSYVNDVLSLKRNPQLGFNELGIVLREESKNDKNYFKYLSNIEGPKEEIYKQQFNIITNDIKFSLEEHNKRSHLAESQTNQQKIILGGLSGFIGAAGSFFPFAEPVLSFVDGFGLGYLNLKNDQAHKENLDLIDKNRNEALQWSFLRAKELNSKFIEENKGRSLNTINNSLKLRNQEIENLVNSHPTLLPFYNNMMLAKLEEEAILSQKNNQNAINDLKRGVVNLNDDLANKMEAMVTYSTDLLKKEMGENFHDQTKRMKTIERKIIESERTFLAQTYFVTSFLEKSNEKFKDITDGQNEIKKGLSKIAQVTERNNSILKMSYEKTLENSLKLDLIIDIEFSKLSTYEKLNMFKSNHPMVLDLICGKERKDVAKCNDLVAMETGKLEIRNGFEKMANVVSGYSQYRNDLAIIATRFGVSKGKIETVDRAFGFAQAGVQIASAFYGNPMGLVSGLAGIISLTGKKKSSTPDYGAIRHEQIMNGLQQLALGQEEILNRQELILQGQKNILDAIKVLNDKIIEGFNKVIANQEVIFKEILTLSEKIDALHKKEMETLKDIHNDLLFNLDMTAENLRKEIYQCHAFLTEREAIDPSGKPIYEFNGNYFNIYGSISPIRGLLGHFSQKKEAYQNCKKGINSILYVNNRFSSNFSYDQYSSSDLGKNLRNQIYGVTYNTFTTLIKGNEEVFKRHFRSFFKPVETVTDIQYKVDNLTNMFSPLERDYMSKISNNKFKISLPADFLELLRYPLSHVSIEEFVNMTFELLPYFEMEDSSFLGLFSLEQLKTRQSLSIATRILEEKILPLIDMAIAQYNFISGDVFLDYLFKLENEKFNKIESMIIANPILAKNFLLYAIRKNISLERSLSLAPAKNIFSYQFALKEHLTNIDPLRNQNPVMLKYLFSNGFFAYYNNFTLVDNVWYLKIRDTHIKLPSVEEVESGQLLYLPGLNNLLALREKVISKIFDSALPFNFDNIIKPASNPPLILTQANKREVLMRTVAQLAASPLDDQTVSKESIFAQVPKSYFNSDSDPNGNGQNPGSDEGNNDNQNPDGSGQGGSGAQEPYSSENDPKIYDLENELGITMKKISVSQFEVGTPFNYEERQFDEDLFEANLSKDFFISLTEVTQKQWFDVMGTNPSFFKYRQFCPSSFQIVQGIALCPQLPVENVSWEDVQKFLKEINSRIGKNVYKLPTEAEWEYAAKGNLNTLYDFGNIKEDLPLYAWYSKNSNLNTHPVASRDPNIWGIYDMYGNVMEWVADFYGKYPKTEERKPVNDPPGLLTGTYRTLRGGNFNSNANEARSSFRSFAHPHERSLAIGFRLVRH